MISLPIQREKTTTVEQQVYEQFKARILNLDLKPGQFINDQEMAEELNVSRTPVRDAFRRLEYEGLLTSQNRRGWQVSPLSLDDVREIFNIKGMLQGLLSYQAATCQDQNLRGELKEIADALQAFNDRKDHPAWDEAHTRYHEILVLMCDYPNGRTVSMISNLNDQWRRIRRGLFAIPGYRDRETVDHVAMAQAILDGNSELAETLTRRHLTRVRDELTHLLETLVFPFASNGV